MHGMGDINSTISQLNSVISGAAFLNPDGTVNVVGHIMAAGDVDKAVTELGPVAYLQTWIPPDVYDYTNKRYFTAGSQPAPAPHLVTITANTPTGAVGASAVTQSGTWANNPQAGETPTQYVQTFAPPPPPQPATTTAPTQQAATNMATNTTSNAATQMSQGTFSTLFKLPPTTPSIFSSPWLWAAVGVGVLFLMNKD